MKDYVKTKVCYSELQADGVTKKLYKTSETAWNKIVKDATEANEAPPEMVSSQTFGYKAAESVDEAVTLSGGTGVGEYENVEVFLQVFNYGASLRQDNEANDILESDTFQPKEGIFDVSYAVAQKSERAKMTPEEQAIKSLAKGGIHITPEQLRAALASIAQAASASA